ncbi:MAG: hypothetical protein FWD61_15380 [Phycisphaerales bacterium]|nr:hypothetical protein [Phycisphaerales bacterium]
MSIVPMSQLSIGDCRELGNNILPDGKSRAARRWLRDPRLIARRHRKPVRLTRP